MRQYKGHWHKAKVLLPMLLTHASQVLVHAIFSGHFCSLWPMIHFLKLSEGLVNYWFDVTAGPHYTPFLFSVWDFTESIVFKSISDKLNINTVIELKIQFFICGFIRSYAHGIYVRPEKHILFREFASNSWGLLGSVLVCLIKLALY